MSLEKDSSLDAGIDSPQWNRTGMERNIDSYKRKLKELKRKNLERFVSDRRVVIDDGKRRRVIPFDPHIDIPQYQLDHSKGGGVGQGKGNVGDAIGRGPGKGNKPGEAGDQPGEHGFDSVTVDEILEMMFEEIDLRRIQPRETGSAETTQEGGTYKPETQTPTPRFNPKRSYKQTIRIFPPEEAVEHMHERPFARYNTWEPEEKEVPSSRVVIIFMLDISGSVTDTIKEKVRQIAFWMTKMLSKQYKHIDVEYIAHDTQANLVSEEQFYTLRAGGGTKISAALELCIKVTEEKYPPQEYDVYPVQLTDGENQYNDNDTCTKLIEKMLTSEGFLPLARYYSLFQVNDRAPTTSGQSPYFPYGSDQTSYFNAIVKLAERLNKKGVDNEVIGLAQIHQDEGPHGIWQGIKTVLGKPKEAAKK